MARERGSLRYPEGRMLGMLWPIGSCRRGTVAAALATAGLLVACGDAGTLAPFATGPAVAGTDSPVASTTSASGSGSDAPATATTDSAGAQWDGELDIVYVRCPRTTESVELSLEIEKAGQVEQATRTMGYADVYDRLPGPASRANWVAPCDLILRHADGTEELIYDCGSDSTTDDACAALDPAVSHDARFVAFSVYRGTIEQFDMRAMPQLLDPQADGGQQSFFDLPNPRLQPTEAQLHLYDVEAGTVTEYAHEPGVFDTAPAFLSTGRIAFISTRSGRSSTRVRENGEAWSTRTPTPIVSQLHSMDPSGRNVALLSPHTMTGDSYPFQLDDGRIALGSWQALGLLPFRYDNGSVGSPGAVSSGIHLQAIGPWGTHPSPLFGQHTHISGGADYQHVGVGRATQSSDGRIWMSEIGGPAGGTIYGFVPPLQDIEGPGPGEVDASGDMFRPADMIALTPWAGMGTSMAAPTPDPPILLDGYADPLVYRGFVRDPEAIPDNELLLSWAKGACHHVGSRHEEIFGDETPPLTSGSNAFVSMNILEYVGADTPGCDAGIYRVPATVMDHPAQLEPVVDTVEFHELMPRALVPYGAVHGVAAPEQPAPRLADLEPGSPLGEVAASSLLLRQTRAADGHPFGSLLQWARQGTDTSDYDDDEVCGVRILATQPNRMEEAQDLRAPPGHRLVVLSEVPVRKVGLVDPLGMPDTSFRARVPADVGLLLQAIDCDGRSLNSSQTPISVRPGEQLACTGCHQRSTPGLPSFDVAASAEDYTPVTAAGTVQLLAGEGETMEVEGWGLTFSFERDVMPIFERRCVSCHAGADAEAGLVLDAPGTEPGSTWWRLVADGRQDYVPQERLAPSPSSTTRVRPPQLTRYIRFMSARGSLLYWKAANRRTDGRSDDQFGPDDPSEFLDVDFGPDHPTDITAEELGVLARWIDTGAGAGPSLTDDTTPPTLSVAVTDASSDARTLVVGTIDVGSGIDPSTLEVCMVAEAGSCIALETPPAAAAGTVEIPLHEQDDGAELRISVADRAGNPTRVTRTIEALRGAFGQGAPDGDPDPDGTDSGDDAGHDEHDEHDEASCACRVRATEPPRAAPLLVLGTVLVLRRRRARTRR